MNQAPTMAVDASDSLPPIGTPEPQRPFRFFDNREKYLLFVTTCGEKWAIAERVSAELGHVEPRPPALRLFDAGTGDGTVLASVLRALHERHPTVPFLVVGKEISLEDVRLTLSKLPDRFAEHPQLVVAITNMHYREAPNLWPGVAAREKALQWREVELDGSTAHEFDQQIEGLHGMLEDWWRVTTSPKTGNPLYENPSVVVLYRRDRRFMLNSVIPKPGNLEREFDLVIAAQPYRARQPAQMKVRYVLDPLARALAPGGRMLTVQSTGQDPGMEILRKVWPEEDPFRSPAPMLASALRSKLAQTAPEREFTIDCESNALFRYALQEGHHQPSASLSTSTLLAAWNAAIYVAQMDDRQVAEAMSDGRYLEATREVLERHGGLWFIDESFVVTRID